MKQEPPDPVCPSCNQVAFRFVNGLCHRCAAKKDDVDELLRLCLAGKDLTAQEYKRIWTNEHEEFAHKLIELIKKQRLKFNPKLKVRRWIIFRCSNHRTNGTYACVIVGPEPQPERDCPCQEPVARGCPLLIPRS